MNKDHLTNLVIIIVSNITIGFILINVLSHGFIEAIVSSILFSIVSYYITYKRNKRQLE